MISPYLKNKKKQEPTPDPYDGHIKPFGSENKKKMTFGGKYEFKVNDVPPPGYYSPERAESITKPKPRACLLYTSPSPRDRQKSRMPSSA